jgi:hypothetical protein
MTISEEDPPPSEHDENDESVVQAPHGRFKRGGVCDICRQRRSGAARRLWPVMVGGHEVWVHSDCRNRVPQTVEQFSEHLRERLGLDQPSQQQEQQGQRPQLFRAAVQNERDDVDLEALLRGRSGLRAAKDEPWRRAVWIYLERKNR